MRRQRRRDTVNDSGFTLLELLVVVAIIAIIGGISIINIHAALSTARGDSAMAQVTSILRQGRDIAIAQRRSVDVAFENPSRIRLLRNDPPAVVTPVGETILENGASLRVLGGVTDTPDQYGNEKAVDFDNSDVVRFMPDGTLTDTAGVPINGTVFMAIGDDVLSARAVTVTGGSGRAQPYRWDGAKWLPR
jgi:prepilin-type N-terminal cleavage/methylation domain-containing protein